MLIPSVTNSTAAFNSQLAQAESSSIFGSSDLQSLPQLSSDQLQQLQQALQQDIQQSFAGQSSNSGSSPNGSNSNGSVSSIQSQLDQSVSNTLGQFGFTDSQKQEIIDKLNQALSGSQGANGHARRGHGRHHAQQGVNGLLQLLKSNSSVQTSNPDDSSTSTDSSLAGPNGSLALPLSRSGQSIDLTT